MKRLGASPGNAFSVRLSATGTVPVTHYGGRTTAKEEFMDMMTNAGNGELPDIVWQDYDLSEIDIQEATPFVPAVWLAQSQK